MKLALAVLFLSTTLSATTCVIPLPLSKGRAQYEIFTGGGTGFGKRSSTQMFYVGGRYGRVLTPDILSGRMRGNIEYIFDALPLFVVFQPPRTAVGGGFNPLILKYNFTSGCSKIPFVEAGGGVLFTNRDVPVNTNHVNFTPQGGFGIHFLRGKDHDRAITASVKYLHVSNSGLDRRNSGINASIQFVLGYTWFK